MMDAAEGLIASCAQGVAQTCERELEWLVTRQSQPALDSRESSPSPSLPLVIAALAAGGKGKNTAYARVTYSDAIKALSQVSSQLHLKIMLSSDSAAIS
jgi:aspartyl/asparaginyl-tRNA synthetase